MYFFKSLNLTLVSSASVQTSMTFANAELTFYRHTCFKGRTVLGLRNKLKIAAQGSLRDFFPLSRSLPLRPSSFSRSLFLSKIAIYRNTRHLSPFRGSPRTRAFCPSLQVPGIAGRVRCRRNERGERSRKKNTLRHFVSLAVSKQRAIEAAESSRETGGSLVPYRPCYFEQILSMTFRERQRLKR